MGAIEDTRKILQDFMAPELRGIQERLEGIDKRFDAIDRHFAALEHKMADDKAELLRTIDFMLRKLSLRIELAAVKNKATEVPTRGASIEQQQ